MFLIRSLVRCIKTQKLTYCKFVNIFLFTVNSKVVFPSDPGVYFTGGLSDVTAIIGTDAELVCRLSSEECDGVWYKDGQEVRNTGVDKLTV